jgi:hypothetical protein
VSFPAHRPTQFRYPVIPILIETPHKIPHSRRRTQNPTRAALGLPRGWLWPQLEPIASPAVYRRFRPRQGASNSHPAQLQECPGWSRKRSAKPSRVQETVWGFVGFLSPHGSWKQAGTLAPLCSARFFKDGSPGVAAQALMIEWRRNGRSWVGASSRRPWSPGRLGHPCADLAFSPSHGAGA